MNVAAEPLSRIAIRKVTWKLREIAGCDKKLFLSLIHI